MTEKFFRVKASDACQEEMPTREFSLTFFVSFFFFSPNYTQYTKKTKTTTNPPIPHETQPLQTTKQRKEKAENQKKKQKNKSQALHKQNTGSLLSSRAPYNESLNDDVIPSRSLTLRPRVFKIPLRLLSVWLAPFSSRALRYSWRFLGDLWWRVASRVCREFAGICFH